MIIAPSHALPDTVSGGAPREDPVRVRDAAEQFESLLLTQILKSVRQSGGGWLGESDPSADCATDFAEEHFATMLARQGGLGLAGLIARGFERDR